VTFLLSVFAPSFLAGWLVDSDAEDDSLPWYVSGALSVVFIITGAVLGLVVLTRFGFFAFLAGVLETYFGFVRGVVEAVAEPVAKVVL